MSSLGRVLAANSDVIIPFTPATYDQAFSDRVGDAAMFVNADSALKLSAVYACTTVIAETTAMVPLPIYERVGDDGKRPARNHPLWDLLQYQPNAYQTAIEFREMMLAFAVLRGRGIAEIIPGPRGPVDQLKPLHPGLVRPEVTETGVLRYRYWDPVKRAERVLLSEEVFVVRGRFGRSVLDYAAQSIGQAMSMQDHQTHLYRRGARPQAVIERGTPWSSDVARTNFRTALDEYALGGQFSGRPLLLEDGMTWHEIGLKNTDLQFVDEAHLSIADMARWFRVPLHKIQELLRATNNNIERQSIDYVTDSILPWAIRFEQAVRRDLIVARDRFFGEHNLDGLLRGDLKARYEAYAIGRQWGWLSTNDIKRRENETPIEGGDDDYLVPLNMGQGPVGSFAFTTRPSMQAMQYVRVLVKEAAARAVRRETAALAKLAERTGGKGTEWTNGVRSFYEDHASFLSQLLHVSEEAAAEYTTTRIQRLLADGQNAIDDAQTSTIADLAELALDRAEPLRLAA